MVKGIIFDFDGVIINSEPLRYKSYKILFLKEFNVSLPDNYTHILGRKQEENIKGFLDMFKLKGNVGELVEKRKKILGDIFSKKENIIPISGILEFIGFLKDKGIKMSIASSSHLEYLRKILEKLDIYCLMDTVVSGEMIKRGKPEPDIFLEAANRMGLKNEECIVIEDSLHGIAAAKKAGSKCIAIASSLKKEDLDEADFVFDDFKEKGIFEAVSH